MSLFELWFPVTHVDFGRLLEGPLPSACSPVQGSDLGSLAGISQAGQVMPGSSRLPTNPCDSDHLGPLRGCQNVDFHFEAQLTWYACIRCRTCHSYPCPQPHSPHSKHTCCDHNTCHICSEVVDTQANRSQQSVHPISATSFQKEEIAKGPPHARTGSCNSCQTKW